MQLGEKEVSIGKKKKSKFLSAFILNIMVSKEVRQGWYICMYFKNRFYSDVTKLDYFKLNFYNSKTFGNLIMLSVKLILILNRDWSCVDKMCL